MATATPKPAANLERAITESIAGNNGLQRVLKEHAARVVLAPQLASDAARGKLRDLFTDYAALSGVTIDEAVIWSRLLAERVDLYVDRLRLAVAGQAGTA